MELPRSRAAADLTVLETATSTNDALRELPGATHFSAVATLNQTAGRGRLGRAWVAPAGKSLAVSVLLTPGLPLERLAWLPLLAGAAMTASIQAVLPTASATLKWPNDVLVGSRKACGILTELEPGGRGVVVGSGVNLELASDELPVPTATSLTIEGARLRGAELVDAVLGGYLEGLKALFVLFRLHGGDAAASGLLDEVRRVCGTLGRRVRVELPSGLVVLGRAHDVDDQGRLVVDADDGTRLTVTAGDVTHLRYE